MTPEEKNALVQFMGSIYGEAKKQDQMLVGSSTNLKPTSNQMKQQFEQVLRTQVQNGTTQPQQPPPALPVKGADVPVSSMMITPEQAAAELAQVQQEQSIAPVPNVDKAGLEVVYQAPAVDPNQMEFDLSEASKLDKLIELIEKQNKILLEIRDSSIKSKYGAKRAKSKRPQ